MVVKIFNNIEIIMRFYFLLWSIGYGVSWIVVKLMLLLCILYSVRGWYCGFSLHYVIFVRLAMWIFLYTPNEVFFFWTQPNTVIIFSWNCFQLKIFSGRKHFMSKQILPFIKIELLLPLLSFHVIFLDEFQLYSLCFCLTLQNSNFWLWA